MFAINVLLYKTIMMIQQLIVKCLAVKYPLIYTGTDSSTQLVQFMINQGYSRIMLITDDVLYQLGATKKLEAQLAEAKVSVAVFNKITPDPNSQLVAEGADFAKQHECDVVVGFGGGSSLDAAKMIAILATTHKPLKSLLGLLKVKRKGLPLYLIPTTSGTGSEVTVAAVITDSESSKKGIIISPHLLPVATALDPLLMASMPQKITADTGFDALTHAIEAYLSTFKSTQAEQYALTAIQLLFKQLPVAYEQADNLAARQDVAIASCYAGIAFSELGLGYVHAISHQIGAKYHLPHGMTNAVVLPHVLRFLGPHCEEKLATLESLVNPSCKHQPAAQRAAQFIRRVKQLQQRLNITTTLACIQDEDIDPLAKAALKEAHYLYPVAHYMTQLQCKELIAQLKQ